MRTAEATEPERPALLLVDDNAAKRVAIQSILRPLGHEVVEVTSGEAALRAVMERPFAVILLDVQMPEMDGYETAKFIRLRRETEHTPIIFITAHAHDEAQVPIAYQNGAVDFLFAPLSPVILRAKVSVFVELFRKTHALERSLEAVTTLSEQFRDSETRTRSVLQHVADCIVTIGEDGRIESFNRAACDTFGLSEADAIGTPFAVMLARRPDGAGDGPDDVRLGEHDRSAVSTGRRRDGSTFPMELDISDVRLGTRTVHIACLRDVSERSRHTAVLQHLALHDDLTGLPNRVLFGDRVEHAIQAAVRSGEPRAVLLLDLNGFKLVNDSYGHHHGDALLKLVGERMTDCLRAVDTVARLGGDEFGILPAGSTDLADAASVAWKIEQALEADFVIEGQAISVRASIGIALVPEHGDNTHDLLRRADLAMYDAKRSNAGSAVFAADQEDIPARRLVLLTDMRHCLERDELLLHFQPKVDLRTRQTVGVEALVRWNHPTRGLLAPGAFMPELENTELILPLTDWVLDAALRALSALRGQGYDLTMAVNLGARCLGDGTRLFDTIDALIRRWDVPPDKLTLELTESALLDTVAPTVLTQLREMDHRLSIDDFGTGYSSLVYLQRLPVVEVKADRSFVSTACAVPDDAVVVRAIVDLAHNLGLGVVAEGVEDAATMDLLVDCDCDIAQGYYFSRPVPSDELLQWLDASPFGMPRRLAGSSLVA